MKTIFRQLFFIGIAFLAFACSDDFLEGKETILYTSSEPLIISSKYPQSTITLTIPEAANHSYFIRTQPKWMKLEPLTGNFSNGVATIQYNAVEPEYQTATGYYTALLVVAVDEVGYFQVEIMYGNFENGGETPTEEEGEVVNLQGLVVDAAYDKNSDQLIIATKNPNQLLVVKTASNTSTVINLDKTPQCIGLSDDGKLYVGFTVAFLSVFELESYKQIKTYTLNCVPFDLALGENGWCYISPFGDNSERLRSLNLDTGDLVNSYNPVPYSQFYGNAIISKVKGKPLLAATRTTVSPTGFMLFDISNGTPNDTLSYWHKDLLNFWTNNDGTRMITGRGQVYFMPEYTKTYDPLADFNLYGQLELSRYSIAGIDESTVKNCLFVASGNNLQEGYNQGETSIIQQFDVSGLTLQQQYFPSMKVIEQDGNNVVAYHDVRYVFANSSGTRLYAVRRIAADFSRNDWSYETFEVN